MSVVSAMDAMNDKADAKEADLLLAAIRQKPDIDAFIKNIEARPEHIGALLKIIREDTGSAKFYCDKAIQKISETNPSLVYPYFHEISKLLDSENNFIKWGAIRTVSNLFAVDREKRFDRIYDKYFGLIDSDSMITASNVIGSAWKYVLAYPETEGDVTARLLKVAENTYIHKGEPSSECRNIAIGHVIDCFDKYFEVSASQGRMLAFAESQRNNCRKSTARKAADFLKKHNSVEFKN